MTTNLLCTFRVADSRCAVPVDDVQEVIRHQELTPVPRAHPAVSGLINLRGQIVTAVDLRRRLGLPDRPAGTAPMNVVVRTADGPKSLLVDDIGDVIGVTADAAEPPPDTLTGPRRELTTRVYKLPDQLLLELDVAKLTDLPPPPTR